MGLKTIDAGQSGGWMPAEDLRETARTALVEGADVTVNLGSIDYLDASALQVLLALALDQKKAGHDLDLVNLSPELRPWFDYSGAASHFSMPGSKRDE
jgi:anti-anti-sigma factor